MTAKNFINSLLNDYVLVQINSNGQTYYDNNSGVIHWDPSKAHKVLMEDGTIEVTSPGRAFLHEMKHRATSQVGEEDEILARNFENQVARELGEKLRANVSIDLGSVTTNNVTAHTDGGKWVTVDPETLEKVLGPNYDPANPVIVIGTDPQPSGGSGGEESGGGSGSSGGGGTTGGGGNPNVDVIPVAPTDPPGPPIRDHEELTYDPNPERDFYSVGNVRKNVGNEIEHALDPDFAMIEIVGSVEPPIFT